MLAIIKAGYQKELARAEQESDDRIRALLKSRRESGWVPPGWSDEEEVVKVPAKMVKRASKSVKAVNTLVGRVNKMKLKV